MVTFYEGWVESPIVQEKKSSVEVPEATLQPLGYKHHIIDEDAAPELEGGCSVLEPPSWDPGHLAPT